MGDLYSMAIGTNEFATAWIAALDLTPEDFERIRDAYLQNDENEPCGFKIVVHTRCGGGNRDEYEYVFDTLRDHPNYLRDQDCEFDDTYADIEFSLPVKYLSDILKLVKSDRDTVVDSRTQQEKWNAAIGKITGRL